MTDYDPTEMWDDDQELDLVNGTLTQRALVGSHIASSLGTYLRAERNLDDLGLAVGGLGLAARAATESAEALRVQLLTGIHITAPKGDGHDAERLLLSAEKQERKNQKRLKAVAAGAFG